MTQPEAWSVQAQIRAFAVENAIKAGAQGKQVLLDAKAIEEYVAGSSA